MLLSPSTPPEFGLLDLYYGLTSDVQVEMKVIDSEAFLDSIYVRSSAQRSGVGTRTLRQITDWADQRGYSITLKPSDGFGVPLGVLVAWYSKHGFVLSGKESMVRYPETAASESLQTSS